MPLPGTPAKPVLPAIEGIVPAPARPAAGLPRSRTRCRHVDDAVPRRRAAARRHAGPSTTCACHPLARAGHERAPLLEVATCASTSRSRRRVLAQASARARRRRRLASRRARRDARPRRRVGLRQDDARPRRCCACEPTAAASLLRRPRLDASSTPPSCAADAPRCRSSSRTRMASLNPRMTVGAHPRRAARHPQARRRARRARVGCRAARASRAAAERGALSRTSSPAGSGSASASRARSR